MKRIKNRKTFIVLLSITLVVIVIIIGIIMNIFAIRQNIYTLQNYEDFIMKQYSSDGILHNQSDCDKVLDKIEKYISTNQSDLGIRKYERNKNSITVNFGGLTHMFTPLIEGYD